MIGEPLVSIIVDNYNYARFVGQAIDSALGQTYRNVEVIVVDDGSTDESRRVLEGYGGRITALFKRNGGQGSAFNAGFAASRGDVVVFLDADDALLPRAVETAVPCFADAGIVKVHWPMWITDVHGARSGRVYPGGALARGDLREDVTREGPTRHLSAPTSGNAWRRRFLAEVLPLPEETYRTAADTPLIEMAPFFGKLACVDEPQSLYRQHDRNLHTAFALDRLIANELRFYDHHSTALAEHLRRAGHEVDLARWKANSWWHRQAGAMEDIGTLQSPGRPIILVDDATWEPGLVHGRRRIPFLEREGEYCGPPADAAHAVRELERLSRAPDRPSHIVFAWCSFWWLEAYPDFAAYLDARHARVLDTPRAIAYRLDAGDTRAGRP